MDLLTRLNNGNGYADGIQNDLKQEHARLLKSQLDTLNKLETIMHNIEKKNVGVLIGPPRPPSGGAVPVPAPVGK
jgi:hypothetical protein